MKKRISLILTLILIITLLSGMPVMAAVNPYDTENNTFSLDFTEWFGDEARVNDSSIVNVPTAENPENTAMKLSKGGYWRPRNSGARKTMVAGNDILLNFKLMIDSNSITSNTGMMYIRAGKPVSGQQKATASVMQLTYDSADTSWSMNVMSTSRTSYTELCDITAGEWTDVSMVLHLTEGKYDISVNGSTMRDLILAQESGSATLAGYSDLLEVVFSTTNSTDTTSTYYIDDLCAQECGIKLTETALTDGNGNKVVPTEERPYWALDTLKLQFTNEAQTLDLKLNNAAISAANIEKNVGEDGKVTYTYIPDTPFEWGTTYTLTGKAKYDWYFIAVPEFTFTIGSQPDKLIEVVGFYNQSGEKLSILESGTITAKLRFWQRMVPTDYTYMLLLTTRDNPQSLPMMVGLTAEKVSAGAEDGYDAKGYTEETIEITVGSQYSDYTLKLLTWNDLIESRTPYTDNYFYGSRMITTPQGTE